MDKSLRFILNLVFALTLSGCVTQSYENDKSTPVVKNESTNNEIAMTRISLGLGYLKMGNTSQAKLNLEKAKRFAPKLVQVHTAFAHYFDSVGEPEQAIASYETALSIKSNDADTLNNYGVFLCKQERYQDAEKQILKAIAQPSYILVSQSYENLALCQLKANEFTKAESYFDKAILHSPSSASALLHMTRLQYAKADYKSAQVFLKRYEKATRRFSADALALAFKIFEKQRDHKTAKNYASMLVKMFVNSYEAKQYLLNGLQEVEADQLAKQYKNSIHGQSRSKKRVVVLSPSKPKSDNQVVNKPVKVIPAIIPATNEQTRKANQLVVKADNAKQVVDTQTKPEKSNVSTEEVVFTPVEKTSEQAIEVSTSNQSEVITEIAKENTDQKKVELPVHVVAKGDSFFSISKKYNIHMKAIERWNGISRAKVLKIGDVIYLADPKK